MVDRDEANAPLIGEHEPATVENDGYRISQEHDSTSPSAFIWALTFAAGISGLLFGYECHSSLHCVPSQTSLTVLSTGVISSTLVSIGTDLGHPLTTLDKSIITSCTSLGALIASPITGILADKFGRRGIILVADVLFTAGALGQTVTVSVPGMVVGRTVVGFAIGGASLVVPLYISELSPSASRGRLVTLSILFITLGQVVAYFVGYVLSMQSGGWRWMVGLGAAPAVLQFGLMLVLPESPRWLVKADKTQEAQKILRKVYAARVDTIVDKVLRAIKTEIAEEEATGDDVSKAVSGNRAQVWLASIRNGSAEMFYVGMNRRALTIACLLQGLQQLCGFVSFSLLSFTLHIS